MMMTMLTRRTITPTALLWALVWSTLLSSTTAWVVSPQSTSTGFSLLRQWQRPSTASTGCLYALTNDKDDHNRQPKEEDDDDHDDDDILDEASLGDWRKFRATLVNHGLSTTGASPPDAASPPVVVPKESEKDNEEPNANADLLEQQNQDLAQEYKAGVWAHTTADPEVGGLLIRMPLEAELYYGTMEPPTKSTTTSLPPAVSYWKQTLTQALALTGPGSAILQQAEQDLTTPQERALLRDAKVQYWFRTVEQLVQQELQAITSSGKVQNGILDPNDLDDNQRLLMDKYLAYKQTWQEVCLLLKHKPESGVSQAVVINRPISTSINKSLAKVLLEGTNGKGQEEYDYQFYDDFVRAFGTNGVVYKGGPDGLDDPALLVHGQSTLDGATEVAPGTGVYTGGIQAAVKGVLHGDYSPLEFRFFLGRQEFTPTNPKRGPLLQHVLSSAYQPVACARPVALKQCLALPKPLWHEVLELCGGELQSLSDIELQKRIDLQ